MKQKVLILLLCQFCLASAPAALSAADVTLAWDPSESSAVAGYRLYGGTRSHAYSQSIDVGNVLTHTVSGLAPETYYFAVTAYDSRGDESAYSNEVAVTLSPKPVILSMGASIVTSNTATIYWKTDLASDSQVEYGWTDQYGSSSLLDPGLVTSHTRQLTGLAEGTTYHYRVKSKTAAGAFAVSGDATFTTPDDGAALPSVTIAATDAFASEAGPTTGTFTVSRSGLSGNATIAAGAAGATIVITPVGDSVPEGNETVVLILTPAAAYTVGSPSSATVTILSDE